MAHVALVVLSFVVGFWGVDAHAQDRASCVAAWSQCVNACRMQGQGRPPCTSTCMDQRNVCTGTPAAGPGQRQLRAAPPQPPAPSEASAPDATVPSVESATPVVAIPAYEGPARYAPANLDNLDPASDRNALAAEGWRIPRGRQQFGDGRGVPLKESALYSQLNPRGARGRGQNPELEREYQALDAAGYRGLVCTYPAESLKLQAKVSVLVSFWLDRRAPISDAMLAAVRESGDADVAVARCPATLGEARAVAKGEAVPMTREMATTAEAERTARNGMRHTPRLPPLGGSDLAYPLEASTVQSALSITGNNSGNRAAIEAASGRSELSATALALDDAKQQVLLCSYARGEVEQLETDVKNIDVYSPASEALQRYTQYQVVRLWYRTRPANVPVAVLRLTGDAPLFLLDLPAERCPDSYAEVLALVDGSAQAMAQAKGAGAERNAKNVGSEAEDRALVQSITAAVVGLDERSGQLDPASYRATVQRLYPDLRRATASALARAEAIPTGAAGRPAFDAWDRAYGGPLLDDIRRLYLVARRHAFRVETSGLEMRDLDKRRNEANAREKEGWMSAVAKQSFTRPLWQALIKTYAAHLGDTPLLDDRYMSGVRAKALAVADARAKEPRPVTVRTTRTVTLFGTPSEIAAARMWMQIGEGIQAIGEYKRQVAELDRRIRQSRAAFWRCYETRCADGGARYLDYSVAMRDKDAWTVYQTAADRQAEATMGGTRNGVGGLSLLRTALGGNVVDDGIILGCEASARAFGNVLQAELGKAGFNASAIAETYVKASLLPQYEAYQGCRDRMEYLLRAGSE